MMYRSIHFFKWPLHGQQTMAGFMHILRFLCTKPEKGCSCMLHYSKKFFKLWVVTPSWLKNKELLQKSSFDCERKFIFGHISFWSNGQKIQKIFYIPPGLNLSWETRPDSKHSCHMLRHCRRVFLLPRNWMPIKKFWQWKWNGWKLLGYGGWWRYQHKHAISAMQGGVRGVHIRASKIF